MNRRAVTYIVWMVSLVLTLGVQQGSFTRLAASAACGSNNTAQQAQGSTNNSEETHEHLPELVATHVQQSGGGLGPTRGWLVLRTALNAQPVPPRSLVSEDPRHLLLPRRGPPPEPDPRA